MMETTVLPGTDTYDAGRGPFVEHATVPTAEGEVYKFHPRDFSTFDVFGNLVRMPNTAAPRAHEEEETAVTKISRLEKP